MRHIRCGRLIPTKPVGKAHPTNGDTSEPYVAGKCDAKKIRLCVSQRTTWFQSHAFGTIRVCYPIP